jgi:hypothetical protein
MIICSCAVISDSDIELAVLDIMSQPDAPLPTPGVVYKHLQKKMNCCSCSPLAIETIYQKMDMLAAKGLICPCQCATAQDRLMRRIAKVDVTSGVASVTEKSTVDA